MPEIQGREVHVWPDEPHMMQHSGQTFVSLGYVGDPRSPTGRVPVWPVDEIAARYQLANPQIERLRRHNPDGVIEGEWPAMWSLGNA